MKQGALGLGLLAGVLAVSCETTGPEPTADPSPTPTGIPFVDHDRDGLDDGWELEMAAAYMPFVSLHPGDECPLGGLLVRVRPHPSDPALLHIVYDQLFERDCGFNGHVGDNEVFAITVNPELPAPLGITAVKAVGHQGTPCQRITECGTCGGLDKCEHRAGYPMLYVSKGKHASYVSQNGCALSCLDVCKEASDEIAWPMVNAGEPDHPLVHNLTSAGFINQAHGWTEESLMDFDPWDPSISFGDAGVVADDLIDSTFLTPPCSGQE